MLRPRFLLFSTLTLLLLPCCRTAAQTSAPMTAEQERIALHSSPEWLNIAAHLPRPDTATAAQLELAGDVLRARRYPQDALDYYSFALARGGDPATLRNKMGVVRLELHQYWLAHQLFQRVVHDQKHNAPAWNNLGATEFLTGNYSRAASDYRHAVKLDATSAVFHANLGLTYFQAGDLPQARVAFAEAVALDPDVLQKRDDGGDSAHLISSSDYPRLCYEFARLAAANNNPAATRLWLAKSVDAGFDPRNALHDDPLMRPYLQDPEVQLILANAPNLHSRRVASTSTPAPSLGPGPRQFN